MVLEALLTSSHLNLAESVIFLWFELVAEERISR